MATTEAAAATPAPAQEPGNVSDAILTALKASGDALVAQLRAVEVEHGAKALLSWVTTDKQKMSLVHRLVSLGQPQAISYAVKELGMDINAQRPSDLCTPLHLSAWTKQPTVQQLLVDLGADASIKNKYGEDCAKLLAIMSQKDSLVWLDLELSSLPADALAAGEKPEILECAVIITDKDLTVLEEGSWVLHHEASFLAKLPEWHQQHFSPVADGGNGLFEACVASDLTQEKFQEDLLSLLKRHCPEKMCSLAGQSVHADREVLLLQLPAVYGFLHHRIVDVSTLMGLMQRWNPALAKRMPAQESYNHRAVADIKCSIESMRWLRSNFLQCQASNADGDDDTQKPKRAKLAQ